MGLRDFLHIAYFFIYIFLGIHALLVHKKSKLNIIFFFMTLSLALWALTGESLVLFKFPAKLVIWLGLVFVLFFLALIIHFNLELTKLFKKRIIIIVLFYITSIIFIVIDFFTPILYKDIIIISGRWYFIQTDNNILFYIYSSYAYLCIISCFIMFVIWGIKTKSKRERTQSIILSTTLIISITLGMFEEAYLPKIFKNYTSHAMTFFFFMIWITAIWFCIIKLRFLTINPEKVTYDIFNSIEEIVVLFDKDLKVKNVNKKAKMLFSVNDNLLENVDISNIMPDYKIFLKEINELFELKKSSFNLNINVYDFNKNLFFYNTVFTLVKDEFKDTIGITMIAKELKGYNQLKKIYKVTEREIEVIQHIINGLSNREISDVIGTTLRTVKAHITNIYNKLNVNNKIQLFNLLNDFDLTNISN